MEYYTVAIIQGLGFAAMGLGIYISLRIFNIPDITTDGSYTLGGAVTAVCLSLGWHPFAALLPAMAGGALAGFATGLIHTKMRVNALLAGILVMTALYSINLGIMGRSNLPLTGMNTIFNFISNGEENAGSVLLIIILFTIAIAGLVTWILKTDLGIVMRATGNSEKMVRAAGVNTVSMKIGGLALANALTALSGYLVVQYQGYADINMGIGIVISGLAAVMIGEALIPSSKIMGNIAAVVAGSIVFRLLLAFTFTLGLHPDFIRLTTALIVLVVLSLTLKRKKMN